MSEYQSEAGPSEKCLLVFASVHQVMKAEKILQKKGLKIDLVPVPREISSDCGVAIELSLDVKEEILKRLKEDRLFYQACYAKRHGKYEKEEAEQGL